MSSLQTAADINVVIIVPNDTKSQSTDGSIPLVQTERRISPSWPISTLKAKLEPITGIPSSCQIIRTTLLSGETVTLSDSTYVNDPRYGLRKGSEIIIVDTRPPAARANFTDVSSVEKYEMPASQYEKLDDSVLAWKRRQKLGRFDPHAKSNEELEQERREVDTSEVRKKGIEVGKRCRVGGEDERRGVVKFVGEIEGLGGLKERGCIWVGVELDEPLGRNDGSAKIEVQIEDESGKKEQKTETKRVFDCRGDKFGVFARPEKVEVGDFPALDDLMDSDMEEL